MLPGAILFIFYSEQWRVPKCALSFVKIPEEWPLFRGI
jgi:hypothetical protein